MTCSYCGSNVVWTGIAGPYMRLCQRCGIRNGKVVEDQKGKEEGK